MHRIVAAVASVFAIRPHELRHGRGGAARMIAAWLSRYEGVARLRKIAATLRLRSSAYVSNLIGFCERQLAGDALLRDLIDQCLASLRPAPGPVDGLLVQYWPALPLTDTVGDAPAYLV